MYNIKDFNAKTVSIGDKFVFFEVYIPTGEGDAHEIITADTLVVSDLAKNPWTNETYPREFKQLNFGDSDNSRADILTAEEVINTYKAYDKFSSILTEINQVCKPADNSLSENRTEKDVTPTRMIK